MLKLISKTIVSCTIAGTALISGTCWMISAKTQVQAIGATPATAEILTRVSAEMNEYAAAAAMIGGFFIAIAIWFEG
ncbi:hypothetical protein [Pseudomonas sp. MWU12-3103b]|uniref:hypothetical protein n=1 Tax=Pseudomonas sp. MWU12-3103b TaxID=2928857 RepID=UPI0020004280|nr:hypothetical protein [Pseudomonas sp. MWU12-3103b]